MPLEKLSVLARRDRVTDHTRSSTGSPASWRIVTWANGFGRSAPLINDPYFVHQSACRRICCAISGQLPPEASPPEGLTRWSQQLIVNRLSAHAPEGTRTGSTSCRSQLGNATSVSVS